MDKTYLRKACKKIRVVLKGLRKKKLPDPLPLRFDANPNIKIQICGEGHIEFDPLQDPDEENPDG